MGHLTFTHNFRLNQIASSAQWTRSNTSVVWQWCRSLFQMNDGREEIFAGSFWLRQNMTKIGNGKTETQSVSHFPPESEGGPAVAAGRHSWPPLLGARWGRTCTCEAPPVLAVGPCESTQSLSFSVCVCVFYVITLAVFCFSFFSYCCSDNAAL